MILTNFIWLLIKKHLVGSDCLGAKQIVQALVRQRHPVCPYGGIQHGLSSSQVKSPSLIPAPKFHPCHLSNPHCSQALDLRGLCNYWLGTVQICHQQTQTPETPGAPSSGYNREEVLKGATTHTLCGWLWDLRGTRSLVPKDLGSQEHRLCKPVFKTCLYNSVMNEEDSLGECP